MATQVRRLVGATRTGDEAMGEQSVLALSQWSRWLAPLALLVGAFAILFQGVKLLFTNWWLTLVQILPAMWIWAAVLDLKAHALHGKQFHLLRGPLLGLVLLVIVGRMAGSFFLDAVFAFAINRPGSPQICPAFAEARQHIRIILPWGVGVGLALGFVTMVVDRSGKFWFSLTLGAVVAIMVVVYVSIPARLIGLKSERSNRDKLTGLGGGRSGRSDRVHPTVRTGARRHPSIGVPHIPLSGHRAPCVGDRSADRSWRAACPSPT